MLKNKLLVLTLALTIGSISSGCNAPADTESAAAAANSTSVEGTMTAPTTRVRNNYTTDVLLFAGSGSWAAEVATLENTMEEEGISYDAVTSAEMNAMTLADFKKYGLLLFPGGAGGTEYSSLTSATRLALRKAVQQEGVSYYGICAGAFISAAPAVAEGKDVSYGLGIVNAAVLDYYTGPGSSSEAAMTTNTFADGTTRQLVWYGGPATTEVKGGVVARYSNGEASISEMWSGNGFVIQSGPHPSAPAATRTAFGLNDADGTDFDLSATLIKAALNQEPLAAF